jgi:hypothetical protein
VDRRRTAGDRPRGSAGRASLSSVDRRG